MSVTIERENVRTINESGELIAEKFSEFVEHEFNRTEEPDYVKLYLDAWAVFRQIPGAPMHVLYLLLPYMHYAEDEQLLYLNNAIKKRVCEKLDWDKPSAVQQLNNAVNKLCKLDVLRRVDYGTYAVNPELVGRGQWRNIKELRVQWELKGRNAGAIKIESN